MKRKLTKMITLIMLGLFGVMLFGCSKRAPEKQYDIYTSIYPLEYLVKNIVDSDIEVGLVYQSGVSVHNYELPPSELVRINKSSAVFFIGAGYEWFFEKGKTSTFKGLGENLVELSKYVELLPDEENRKDPYIWLDPQRMITMADVIKENLERIYPDKTTIFAKNHATLVASLNQLDASFATELERFSDKSLVIDHDVYRYLMDRFEIKRIKTRYDNFSSDIATQEYDNNVKTIKELGIKHIALTQMVGQSAVVDRYIADCQLEKVELFSIESLTNQQIADGVNYDQLMRHNLAVLKVILDY